MNRISAAIAAALILLAAGLVVFAPGSSSQSGNQAAADSRPPGRAFRNPSAPTKGSERPATIAERISRPLAATSPAEGTLPDSPPAADRPPPPAELRRAAELRQTLRREGEKYDEATGNVTVLQPAAFIDLAEQDSQLPTEHHDGIRQIAEEFEQKIADSGLDPASPEYRKLWNEAVRESDWKFRARYGARAWSRQHIRAHHLANSDSGKP